MKHSKTLPRQASAQAKRWGPRAAFGAVVSAVALMSLAVVSGPWTAFAAETPVNLGTAGAYSVLGGQTVTNTGPTTLNANLGVSPGSAITGFPPGVALGATNAGNAAALQAQSDLVVAYDDAASRAPTESVAGDLVGRTLQAGVYNSTGPLALSGTVTLDAAGDPDAVFIFQVASTLMTESASNVALIGGAQACNVYWQIGSSATLGTNSVFRGSILALTSITVTTGTTVEGRALARDGSVTLDNNTFVTSDCAPTAGPTETATPSATPVPTAGPTETATPSATPVPTAGPTETATPVPTPAPTAGPTETATPAPTPVPTAGPTETAIPAPAPTPAPTVSAPAAPPVPTAGPTETAIPAPAPTPAPTVSAPAPTVTAPAPAPAPTVTAPVPVPVPVPVPDNAAGGDAGAAGSTPGQKPGASDVGGAPSGTNRGTNIQTAASGVQERPLLLPSAVLAGAGVCAMVAVAAGRVSRTARRH